jgi:hypothetical protein
MKKFIANLFLVCLIMLCGNVYSKAREITTTYNRIPSHININEVTLQRLLILASWSANYSVYYFDECSDDVILCSAAYTGCSAFYIRFNKETRDCEIEFNADDDSFDYYSFIHVFDAAFLCD